ncbi:MAG: HipA N-terminal domain-containing protein [Alcanivoracaceae bacterium]|nr:HipA N-terminal domain-containing protein [Alcanivoracaceae bacterium]
MRQLIILKNNIKAGILTETDKREYIFRYDDGYFNNSEMSAISLTLPKLQQEFRSEILFPFFFNILSEGVNLKLQSKQLKIDENDFFGLLMATARFDTIGAISVALVNA